MKQIGLFSRIRSVLRNQFANARYLLAGDNLMTPPLVASTTDADDLSLAWALLQERGEWFSDSAVGDFERKFAAWNGSKYAFAFMGGRVALSAAIEAIGLKAGDEVVVPGYTCIVVANSFRYAGVNVRYADIELDTFGLDAASFRLQISPSTKAVVVQHLYGLVCRDYEEILAIAKQNGLKVIEDCAHASGARFRDVKVGNRGDVAFYSSEHSKAFSTVQGGVVVTNDDVIAANLRQLYEQSPYPTELHVEALLYNVILDYFREKHKYRFVTGDIVYLLQGHRMLISTTRDEIAGVKPSGYGARMPSAVARLGINQLAKLDSYNRKRRQAARLWGDWCDSNGYKRPVVIPGSEPIWLRYPVLVEPERKVGSSWYLNGQRIAPGVWFVGKLHPAEIPADLCSCPRADEAVARCINFPTLLDERQFTYG